MKDKLATYVLSDEEIAEINGGSWQGSWTAFAIGAALGGTTGAAFTYGLYRGYADSR
jgi:lactobin A/cerein 7B family class IIb bacteriocin